MFDHGQHSRGLRSQAGFAVLPVLGLIAIVGSLAVIFDAVQSNPLSQTAGARLAADFPSRDQTVPVDSSPTKTNSSFTGSAVPYTDSKQFYSATDAPMPTKQDSDADPDGTEKSPCQPGDKYKIVNGQTQTCNGKENQKTCKTQSCEGSGRTTAQVAACREQNPQCEVEFCDANDKNCRKVRFTPGQNDAAFQKALNSGTINDFGKQLNQQELAKILANMTQEERKQILPNLGLPNNTVNGAFSTLQQDYARELNNNARQIDNLQAQLDTCAQQGSGICYDDRLVDRVAEEQQKLQESNKELEEQMQNLATEQKALTPEDGKRPDSTDDEPIGSVDCNEDRTHCTGVVYTKEDVDRLNQLGFTCEQTDDGIACERTQAPGSPCRATQDCGGNQTCNPGTKRCEVAPQRCPNGGTPPDCSTFTPGPCPQQPPKQQNPIQDLMKSLGKMFGGGAKPGGAGGGSPPPQPQQPPQQCSTDSAAYQQQQQQYQQQQQQYNYQLQQYNYQQQLNQYNSTYYGNNSVLPPPPMQPRPSPPSTGNQCQSQPQQPPASSCTVGTWRATYSGVCITGWQCIPNTSEPQIPKAQLSCEPQVADVGMSLNISYSCSAGTASSNGFKVTTQPSGSATTIVTNPPAGTNTATHALTCTHEGKTAGAQCSVQVNRPSIILVANPKTAAAGGTSLLGWLTTGMQSCTVSSPDQADFTARNSSNTSVNGAATTSPITSQARFLLHCETISGGTKDATTTIRVIP